MTTATKLRQEGRMEGRMETIVKMYQRMKLTIDQIAEGLEIDKSFVENTLRDNGLM